MDPITILSTTATAIELVQVATDVFNALHQYIAAVIGAESSYSELIDQITLISKAAQAAKSVLENSPPSFRTPEQQALHTEWFRNDGSPARCKKELEDLLSWLCSQTGGKIFTRGIKKFFWPVKEKRIRAAIPALDGHMPYFHIMLSLDNSSWLRGIHSEIKNEHEHARNIETADARRELLQWLDELDCTVKHETTRELRQKTTGEWLLNEKLYVAWRNGSIKFLWLGGKPGAGKSVLASTIIDNLSSGPAKNETLAYFYCDFRTPRSTSTMEILRSLTVQFLRNSRINWLSCKPFSGLVTRKEQGAGPPVNICTLSDLLRGASRLHQRPMIVIDALDECDDLSKLLPALVTLHGDGHCRVFVTSRPLYSINQAFVRLPSISLDDKVDAVREDMYFHINTEIESRDGLKALNHDLQDDIRVAVMKQANGMFRLMQLQLDRLDECLSLGDLREALDTIPATLYETYDRMLRAIDKKEFGSRVARRALMWLVTALDSLTLSQLAQALAFNVDEPALDSTVAPMRETGIVKICSSLVSYNERTSIITLSHYSVKQTVTRRVCRVSTSIYAPASPAPTRHPDDSLLPVLVGSWSSSAADAGPLTDLHLFPAGLFLVHCANRDLISPLRTPSRSKDRIIVLLTCIFSNLVTGILMASYVRSSTASTFLSGALEQPSFWVGTPVAAFCEDILRDEILLDIRRDAQAEGKAKSDNIDQRKECYGTPHDYLYRYISYQNYFCEWTQWFGYEFAAAPIPP
ncbi:hypothetical protein BU15DRAFT_83131 [Melanogaster broomeanus]|nr:hypothetical protein BU15DRAFT_83131 [Melanogaster broomeanus]